MRRRGALPPGVDVLVVGAGYAGTTVARALADSGYSVLVIDRRSHVGGNAFDELDAAGVRVHRYGPHAFHTSSRRVFAFLSRFTSWYPYEHRVLSLVGEQLVPFPVNRNTINALYGLSLDDEGAAAFLARVREPVDPIRTSEDVVLAAVGRDLCEKLFRGYTRKQWGLDLSELQAGVAARVGVRTDADDRYFRDPYQGIPAEGYTTMFERMLDHEGIRLELGCRWDDVRDSVGWRHLVFTGPVDAFFDYRFGALPYRSIRFEHEHLPGVERLLPVGTVNYPNHHAHTRTSEFKHFTGQVHSGTSVLREYPSDHGDPLYPVPRPQNEAQYRRYADLASRLDDVTFVGRLAQYRYYDMDQVVAAALASAEKIAARLGRPDACPPC